MTPGDYVRAKLRRGEHFDLGADRIVDRYKYRVTVVEGATIGVDDGDPVTRWPAHLFTTVDTGATES